MENKEQKFDKPTKEDIHEIIGAEATEEIVQLLLEQMEELCLIVIEQHANGQKI